MDVFLNTADPQPPTTSNQPFKDTAAIFKPQDDIFKLQDAIFKPEDTIFKPQDAIFKLQDAIFKPQDALQDVIFKPQDAAIFSHKTRNFDWTDISVFGVDSNASLLDSAVYKTGFLDINISAEFWRGDAGDGNGTPCSWETCSGENGTSGAYQVGDGSGSDDKNWPFLLLILLVFNV